MTATADAVTVSISDALRADRPPEQGDDDHHEQPEADQPQCAGDEPVEHGEGSPEGERADGNLRCERNSGRWRRCVRTIEVHAPMVEVRGSAGVRGHLSGRGFADLGSLLVALVRIPNTLRSLTGGVGELTVDGADLAAVLVALEARHPVRGAADDRRRSSAGLRERLHR